MSPGKTVLGMLAYLGLSFLNSSGTSLPLCRSKKNNIKRLEFVCGVWRQTDELNFVLPVECVTFSEKLAKGMMTKK
jgi:hypothetical protein